jgi:predicted dehydrogenase
MINWGIIGTGFIANEFARDFKHVEEGRLVAVASRSQANAEAFANKFNIEKTYDSYEQLAKDQVIDVVYVATPNTKHKDHSMLCLKNNKHVLCEKPVTVNSEELNKIIALANDKNLLFMEAMWMLFQPGLNKAKEWIESNKIGEIKTIKAEFGFKAEYDPDSRLFNPQMAGGSLLDIGIYPITLTSFLLEKEPEEIQSMAYIGDSGVDEQLSLHFRFDQDQMAMLSSSFLSQFKDDAIIYGTKGYIHIPSFWNSKKAILKTENEELIYDDPTPIHGYAFEANHVNKILKLNLKESPIISHHHSLQVMQTMDQVREQINLKYPFE